MSPSLSLCACRPTAWGSGIFLSFSDGPHDLQIKWYGTNHFPSQIQSTFLRILILPVPLQMIVDRNNLLDQMIQILRNPRSKSSVDEISSQLVGVLLNGKNEEFF